MTGVLADGLFKKAAEILFVHACLPGQVVDIEFFLIMFMDVSQGIFDDFHSVIIGFLLCGQQSLTCQNTQYFQEAGPDKELEGRSSVTVCPSFER